MLPPPRTVQLSNELYPTSAIEQARAAFKSLCKVERQELNDTTTLTIVPLEGSPPETADEFLNYTLCAALERRLVSGA